MTRALMLMVLLAGCDEVDKATDAVAEVLTGGQEGEAEGGEEGLDPDAGSADYGYAVGDIIPDVALTGPDGSAGLHDYADGGPTVVVFSTMWAAPCAELAPTLQELWEEHADDGFTVVEVLQENLYAESPSDEELTDWADTLGLTYPVVTEAGDAGDFLAALAAEGTVSPYVFPAVVLLDADMRIESQLSADPDDVVEEIEAYLAE